MFLHEKIETFSVKALLLTTSIDPLKEAPLRFVKEKWVHPENGCILERLMIKKSSKQ